MRGTAPIATSALVLTALASLASVPGSSTPFLATAAAVLLFWAIAERRTSARLPRVIARAADLLTVTLIVAGSVTLFALEAASLLTLGYVLAVAQLSRAFRDKSPSDLAVMHGTALAHLALAASLTRDAFYLPILAVAIILGVAASLAATSLHHPRGGGVRIFVARPRGGAGVRARVASALVPVLLGLTLLVLGAGFFVMLPRGAPFMAAEAANVARREVYDPNDYSEDVEGAVERIAGFTDRVRLGEVGEIKLVPREAFRVATTVAGAIADLSPRELYFRGAVLDRWTGEGWVRSAALRAGEVRLRTPHVPGVLRVAKDLTAGAALRVEQVFTMKATTSRALPALAWFAEVRLTRAMPRVLQRGGGTYEADTRHEEGFVWHATSFVPVEPDAPFGEKELPSGERQAALAFDESGGRVGALAREVAGSGVVREKVGRLMTWLNENCEYTLHFKRHPSATPIEDFLFEARAGHCEYFATALVLLLRSAGIPARLVAGYRGGQWLAETEEWYVRMSDAHSWVEAHVTGEGWIRLDPTPADATALNVPPSRVPGSLAPIEPGLGERILAIVRGFGPEERDDVFRAVGRGTSFVLREGIGVGRDDRPWPPPLPLLAGLLVAGLTARRVLRSVRAERRGRRDRARDVAPERPETPFYEEALRLLTQIGVARRRTLTPTELSTLVQSRDADLGVPFANLTRIFLAVRFGDRPLDDPRKAAIAGSLADMTSIVAARAAPATTPAND
jgi:transglutaminase-like putative cysteine protease